jgi:hypothetical protein
MRLKSKVVAALLGLVSLPAAAWAAIIGGTNYATQYDYREFFAATDGRTFQVVLAGNPFPSIDPNIVARDLLPAMQAAKPRPALTFTYDAPVEALSQLSAGADLDPANDLGADPVCRGATRFAGPPGRFHVYAVYCRNDMAMSETTA